MANGVGRGHGVKAGMRIEKGMERWMGMGCGIEDEIRYEG